MLSAEELTCLVPGWPSSVDPLLGGQLSQGFDVGFGDPLGVLDEDCGEFSANLEGHLLGGYAIALHHVVSEHEEGFGLCFECGGDVHFGFLFVGGYLLCPIYISLVICASVSTYLPDFFKVFFAMI